MSSRYKAYFFKLKPNGAQTRDFAGSCGCARLVCNKGIEWYNEQRKQNPEFRFSCTALANLFSQWTQEEDKKWLAKGHSQMLQQAFKDLERGFINFWEGRTNFPKFHKKFQSTNNFPLRKPSRSMRAVGSPPFQRGWVKYHRKSLH